jgi:hypothetical protein
VRKKIWGYVSFAVAVLSVIVLLKVFNWIPMRMQQDTLREYENIEEIRRGLQISEVYAPSYFPGDLAWPPSRILAQRNPFPAVIMFFKSQETGETALIVAQVAAGHKLDLGRTITIDKVKEEVRNSLKGREALLTVGLCTDGQPCSRISWDEGGYKLDLRMRAAPFELIKIANSMIHQPGGE